MTGVISRMRQLINNLCGEFLVGSVSSSGFSFLLFFSVTSVSSYHLISFWITFGVILSECNLQNRLLSIEASIF